MPQSKGMCAIGHNPDLLKVQARQSMNLICFGKLRCSFVFNDQTVLVHSPEDPVVVSDRAKFGDHSTSAVFQCPGTILAAERKSGVRIEGLWWLAFTVTLANDTCSSSSRVIICTPLVIQENPECRSQPTHNFAEMDAATVPSAGQSF